MFIGPKPRAPASKTKTGLISVLILLLIYFVWIQHDKLNLEVVSTATGSILAGAYGGGEGQDAQPQAMNETLAGEEEDNTGVAGIPKKIWYKLGPKGLSEEMKEWTASCIDQNPDYQAAFLTVSPFPPDLTLKMDAPETNDESSRTNWPKITSNRPSPPPDQTLSTSIPNSPSPSSKPTSCDTCSSTPKAASGLTSTSPANRASLFQTGSPSPIAPSTHLPRPLWIWLSGMNSTLDSATTISTSSPRGRSSQNRACGTCWSSSTTSSMP